jgi:hypothetical protein
VEHGAGILFCRGADFDGRVWAADGLVEGRCEFLAVPDRHLDRRTPMTDIDPRGAPMTGPAPRPT